MNTNSIARIANILRINTNLIVNNTHSVKEDTSMNTNHPLVNTVKSLAARAAKTLGALALLTLATVATAKADVVVDDWVQPSHNTMVTPAPGTTVLQLKLYNANNYNVSNVKANVTFWRPAGSGAFANVPQPGSQTTATTTPISMTPFQDVWVNVSIPYSAPNGTSYYGNTIAATIALGSNSFTINFQDVAPAPALQMSNLTPPASAQAGSVFSVVVTNNGYAASTAQTITGMLYANAEGRVSPYYTLSGRVPALQRGVSAVVNFYLPQITTYNNTGYSNLLGWLTLGAQTLNFSF